MTRLLSILFLMISFVFSLWSQARGVKPVEMENEKGERFVAYENSYAFIVGINEYKDPKIPSLKYAVDDANAIAKMLEGFDFPKENTTILLNQEATLARIKEAFEVLGQKTKKDDRLLVYWAGHGESETTPRGEEAGYLIPSDGRISSKYSTCLSMDDISRMTKMVAAKHILFLVDACYGGLSAVTRSIPKETEAYLQKVTSAEAVQIITAGTKDEQVVESPAWKHSAFAKAILEGFDSRLVDTDNNSVVTADELSAYLQTKVYDLSRSERPPGHRPVYARLRSSEGQFTFVVEHPEFSLTIDSLPPTNQVLIDGKKVSENAVTVQRKMRKNTYIVEIESPGYLRYSTSLYLSSDRTLKPKLPEATARDYTLTITHLPDSSTVYIDGRKVSEGKKEHKQLLKPGSYTLRVEANGEARYCTLVDIQGDKDITPLYAVPDSTPGSKLGVARVDVEIIPSEAILWLDGKPMLTDSGKVSIELKPGVYTFRASRDGYEEEQRDIVAKPGESYKIPFELPKVSFTKWLYRGAAVAGVAVVTYLVLKKKASPDIVDPYGSPPALPVEK